MPTRSGDWVREDMVIPLLKERLEESLDLVEIVNLGCPDVLPLGKPALKWHQHSWVQIPSSAIYLLTEMDME